VYTPYPSGACSSDSEPRGISKNIDWDSDIIIEDRRDNSKASKSIEQVHITLQYLCRFFFFLIIMGVRLAYAHLD
jgi:hypothetical protein